MSAEQSRRAFLGNLSRLAGLAGGLVAIARQARAAEDEAASPTEQAAPEPEFHMPRQRFGMVIDLDLCTGCAACVVSCRSENNVPAAGREPEKRGTEISWMALLKREHETPAGERTEFLPTPCMHCENPSCVKVCPVGATYKNDDGLVVQIWDRCIGCRYCQVACPYSRRYFNWSHEIDWPESYKQFLNPDVATRPGGVIEKCTFCSHRIRRVKETAKLQRRAIEDSEWLKLPACAAACPAGAITFGDFDDPASTIARQSASPRAFRLLEDVGTKPKVVYLGKDRRSAT